MTEQLVKWSPSYSLGLEEIDEQHKSLFELINKIWQAIIERAGHKTVVNLVNHLEHYARDHFAEEEIFMHAIEYPDFEQHHQAHILFIERIAAEKRLILAGSHLSLDLVHFLNDWLSKHILVMDKAYAEYTQKRSEKTLLSRFFKRFGAV